MFPILYREKVSRRISGDHLPTLPIITTGDGNNLKLMTIDFDTATAAVLAAEVNSE